MKKRNSVKRQIPSIDDKELYEIYMRNHDECKKKIHKQIDACLDEAFPNSSSYKENDLEGDVTFGNFEMGRFEPIDRTEKNRSEQYVDKFMVDADFTVRPRKQIYIREETHELGCSKFRYKSDIKSARIQLVKLLTFNTLYCEIVL